MDDRHLIVGSANVNDRSMLGTRDSEFCVYVQDAEVIEKRMAGELFEVCPFVQDVRMRLLCEHLGLTEQEALKAIDPCSAEFI